MKLAGKIVKHRIPILILAILLLIPAGIGFVKTRVNYDMLTYLPEDMDTVVGQNLLLDEFHKGAFTFIIVEDMSEKDVAALKQKIEAIDHVETVIWYDSVADLSIPMEMIPNKLYKEFNSENSTMMAAFFDSSTSADETIEAVKEIRKTAGEQCFISGMTALVIDLKDLCEKEEPVYVVVAVVLASVSMFLFLDSFLVPFAFLASIGMAVVYNLGSNIMFGEISYITKALSAVLQLAVTMDYSIFLWHSYNEQLKLRETKEEAMTYAITNTFTSVLGSSITTVAGFIALCFMSFTLGRDLGLVMAKGVLMGVITCVTVLPAIILIFDKPLQKTRHKSLIPNMDKFSDKVIKIFPLFIIIFVLLLTPALYGYTKSNNSVYYDLGDALPSDMNYVISAKKLREDYHIASTHMVLINSDISSKEVREMIKEMEQVDGVKYVLGIESVLGSRVPKDFLPEELLSSLENDELELLLINSEYKVASDEVNLQLDELNTILKKYDPDGTLIGEAPCMKDMIDTTSHDFKVVNTVSIIAVFVIILLVEQSISLPVILIAIIELGIFINLGLPYYLGQNLSFITPICISTIQLGATVDYAILLTTRYKSERAGGLDKKAAVKTALSSSIPSVLVSGLGLFSATIGVAVYSNMDIISSMCMLMARGAVISMLLVIFILPAFLVLFDPIICHTTIGMLGKKDRKIRFDGKEKLS